MRHRLLTNQLNSLWTRATDKPDVERKTFHPHVLSGRLKAEVVGGSENDDRKVLTARSIFCGCGSVASRRLGVACCGEDRPRPRICGTTTGADDRPENQGKRTGPDRPAGHGGLPDPGHAPAG